LCYPSLQSQQQFLSDFYVSLDEDVHDEVEYVEAHGLGIPDVDRDEVGALARVLCQDRAGQLQIGSVKASTGHTLSVSVLVSIAKILVAMGSGMIPANTEFAENNPKISPLRDGRVKIVKENTRMHHGYCAVNSLGMGGYHSHTLLLANEKTRALHYMASHSARLCVYQGVTEEGLHKLL
ncbi:FAS-like protein, partial [Mya arenaria]